MVSRKENEIQTCSQKTEQLPLQSHHHNAQTQILSSEYALNMVIISPHVCLDKHGVDDSLPRRHLGKALSVGVDVVPRQLAAAGVKVNLVDCEPASALPDEAADPE
jgi:hypothetical protein